jgi:hypothetical protein
MPDRLQALQFCLLSHSHHPNQLGIGVIIQHVMLKQVFEYWRDDAPKISDLIVPESEAEPVQ